MAARRRPRALLAVLVVLVVVVVAAVVVDRVVAGRTAAQASRQLQSELGTPDAPQVDIGFPLLTGLPNRSARSVRLQATDVPAQGPQTLPLSRLDVTAEQVRVPPGNEPVTAGRVAGTATVDLADLPEVAGRPLTYAGNGRVAVDADSFASGAQVTGRPELDPAQQTVTLADPRITVGGVELPAATAQSILDQYLEPVPLTGVPLDLRVTSLTVDEAGAQVGVAGDDVVLPR